MQSVKVKRKDVLKRIKGNRDRHRAIFEEAQKEYRKLVIKELDAMLKEAKNGKRIRRSVSLIEPVDQTAEYDRVIDMLENSVDDTIELEAHDYAQYMRDEWTWKRQWSMSNVMYSKTLSDNVAKGSEPGV